MKNRRWVDIAKWGWVLLVFGGVVYYISKNHETLLKYLGSISIPHLLLSMVLLAAGKLFLTRLSIDSISDQAWQPRFSRMFHINSMMQLAKYLPGGVWHFVGRFGLYRANGISNAEAGRSILIENIWLVASAVFFGLEMIVLPGGDMLLSRFGIVLVPWTRAALLAAVLSIWFIALVILDRVLLRGHRRTAGGLSVVLLTQFLAWLFLGAGFWVMLLPVNGDLNLAGPAMGAFALSWAAGYLTIFAPSGLGVREVAIGLILGGLLTPEVSLIYATINRFVWVVVELGLGIYCELVYGSGNLSNLFRADRAGAEENARN